MRKSFFLFVILIIFTTFVCGLVYIAVQQDIRQSANDPQIQMAEDGAVELSINEMPQALFAPKVNLITSISPFLITYNDNDLPIQSSGLLNGKIPVPPSGVFDYVKKNQEDRITWQPENGIRIATVIVHFKGQNSGFVLAGRSLREVEKREDSLMKQISLAWIIMIALGFGMIIYKEKLKRKI